MRKTFLLLCLLASCGADECHDYAVVFCGKIALCDMSVWTNTCEQATEDNVHASKLSQDQCKKANATISPMGCAQFNAFLSAVTK